MSLQIQFKFKKCVQSGSMYEGRINVPSKNKEFFPFTFMHVKEFTAGFLI